MKIIIIIIFSIISFFSIEAAIITLMGLYGMFISICSGYDNIIALQNFIDIYINFKIFHIILFIVVFIITIIKICKDDESII